MYSIIKTLKNFGITYNIWQFCARRLFNAQMDHIYTIRKLLKNKVRNYNFR